jgi:phosphoenolpyruvate-protein kinase (PTS system EI component)
MLATKTINVKPQLAVGAMIESGAAVAMAYDIAMVADFISIGTRDLTSSLFSRGGSIASDTNPFTPHHPAVIRVLNRIIKDVRRADSARHKKGISGELEISVCGKVACETEFTPVWIGLGIRIISADAGSIPKVNARVSQCELEACKRLVKEMHDASTPEDSYTILTKFLRDLPPPALQSD